MQVLEARRELVDWRDDLTLELCALLNGSGRHREAQNLLASRNFQPWEGGEGIALGQHVQTHLALGRAALREGEFLGMNARPFSEMTYFSAIAMKKLKRETESESL